MDNSNVVLINDLINQPSNPNIAYNNSWLNVGGAPFPLFAQASYITNFSDLSVTLSSSHVVVGDFNLADPISGLNANVVQVGLSAAALRVLTQNFDSVYDSFTIGDVNGKLAYVTNSALNVFTINPVNAVSITNPVTGITVLNPVNAVSITNPVTGITVLNPVNAVSITNPVTSVNVKSLVTNWDVLSAAIDNTTYTTLPSNPANEITILNNTGGTMYVKNASKTIGLPIDNNTSVDLRLVGDTSEVAIKASSANKTVFATFISYN
jgi:hypothetical protein